MSFKLSDLSKDTKEVKVPFGENTLTIEYRVDFYTAEVELFLRGIKDSEQPMSDNVSVLARMIQSWDAVDDKGKAIKPTEDVLRSLGAETISKILSAIFEDANPNA